MEIFDGYENQEKEEKRKKTRNSRIIEKVDKILCFPIKNHEKQQHNRDFTIYKNFQYDSCTTFDRLGNVFAFYSVYKF